MENHFERFETFVKEAKKMYDTKLRKACFLLLIPIGMSMSFLLIMPSTISTIIFLIVTLWVLIIIYTNNFQIYARFQGIFVNYDDINRRHFARNNIKYLMNKNQKRSIINKLSYKNQEHIHDLLNQASLLLED